MLLKLCAALLIGASGIYAADHYSSYSGGYPPYSSPPGGLSLMADHHADDEHPMDVIDPSVENQMDVETPYLGAHSDHLYGNSSSNRSTWRPNTPHERSDFHGEQSYRNQPFSGMISMNSRHYRVEGTATLMVEPEDALFYNSHRSPRSPRSPHGILRDHRAPLSARIHGVNNERIDNLPISVMHSRVHAVPVMLAPIPRWGGVD